MQKPLLVFTIMIFSTSALAGCLGGEDEVEADEAVCEVCKEEVTEAGLGGIKGFVRDLSLQPVENANVSLREVPGATTKTGANGAFAFGDLLPGDYTIVVQKPGFIAGGNQVAVGADEIVQADVQIEELPPEAPPYMNEVDFGGQIACAFAVGPIATVDQCEENDPNARSNFVMPLDAGLTGMAIAIVSDGNGNFDMPTVRLKFSVPVTISHEQFQMRGKPTFEKTYDLSEVVWADGELPIDAKFSVRPVRGDSDTDYGIAYQLKFQVYVGLFYNGMPIPDGYSPVPDA